MSERIFDPASDIPSSTNVNDGDNSKTLGMVVSLTEDMYCDGGAWYVPDTVPEIVTGALWEYTNEASGILRASKNLTGVTSGWFNWAFDAPYLMDHTKLYVISVFTRTNYVITGGKFAAAFSTPSGKCTAIADGVVHNGRFHDAAGNVGLIWPEANFNKSWYGLDIFVSPAAVTLAVANAEQAQEGTSPTLVRIIDLAPSNAEQTQESANLTLTQTHNITVQNAQQIQEADSVALTQIHVLTVANGQQTQFGDQVDFNAPISLAGNVHGNNQVNTGAVIYTPVALSGTVE